MGINCLNSDGLANQLMPVSLSMEQATSLIVKQANQLVNKLIEDRGHDKPPFLAAEFARLQGIKKIVKEDLGEESAVLLRFHDGPMIKLNQKHNLARQNFSCAHEIGHNLLRELKIELNTENIEYRGFNPQAQGIERARDRERLCDAAATELLMPELVFRRYLSDFSVSINSIERLANIFKVSFQTVAIRIAEVSVEPCLALLWKPWPRNKPKGLRFSVPRRNSRGKVNYMPVHTLVRYPSQLHKAYE